MESVGFATLFTAPRPIKGLGNVSELWCGNAVSHDGEVRLYIKKVSDDELLSECLAAVLADSVDLPVPRTYIVRDPARVLGAELFIGSEDEGAPSIRQRLRANDPAVEKALLDWDRLHDVAIFDEWIANPDRNIGNLLWDGSDGWTLIDHAYALWSGLRSPRPDLEVQNKFAELVIGVERDMGAARLRRRASPLLEDFRGIDMGRVHDAARGAHIGMSEQSQNALSCVQRRVELLTTLLSRHGNQPDLLA